jgi:hypothetical protein
MDANPIGLAIVGAAALAAIGYEIYQHWAGIADFFKGMWNRIASIDWRGLGMSILKFIGEGFMMGLGPLGSALEKVGGFILDHFKGHSPPPLGPLHDLGRVNIVETIAERIKPGPVISAAGRTAAAIAMAAPLIAASAAPGMAGGAANRASAGIVINAPVTVTVGAGDKDAIEKIVVGAFNRHRYELVRAMQSELARRERTTLS